MSFWCPTYRGFHHFDTPKHANALGNIEVIKKCRCGETRTEIRYLPQPDTEEAEAWEEGEEQEYEGDQDYQNFSRIISTIIAVVFMLALTAMILPLLLDTTAQILDNITAGEP